MKALAALRHWPLAVTVVAVVAIAAGCSSATSAQHWTYPPADASSGLAAASAAPPSVAPSPSVAPPVTPSPSVAPTIGPVAIDFVPGTVAAPRNVNMTADDNLNFIPGSVPVAKGETVTFQIHNVGKAEHEFMVGPMAAAFADKEGTPEVAGIKGGQTGTLTVTFDKNGQFAFACHMPGHYEHGMIGFIVLVGQDAPAMGTVAQPRPITIDMTDALKFNPDSINVRKGETIRFILTNSGKTTHEFMIGPADKVANDDGDGKITVEADKLDGGSTNELVYTFDGPGPYAFACHEPGHFESGMAGTVQLVD